MDRLGQCRPQHHDHPLELPSAGEYPVLRMVDEALGGTGARPQLQCDGQPARRGQSLSLRPAAWWSPLARQGNARRLNGVDAELLDRSQARARLPFLDYDNARFPIHGGLLQGRGGTARHDAVVWGYARAASDRGVDIVQNCEVTGFIREAGRVVGVETTRGTIRARKIGMAVAGSTSRVAALGRLKLPIE